ncbi:restriction endonuclease subunit R, partial [Candidatus Poribacteria bacterium]|nr:restriction endonuclease subunit R [Candidatus Poribacteria bacterium]
MPRKKTKELNNHLILHGWLNDQFGYNTTRELLNGVANIDEGFNANGLSPICEFLMSRPDLKNEIEDVLPIYDANIKRHLAAINSKRTQPIVLRYFQYLALLYTEIFLDWKFSRPAEFLHQLNTFVQTQNARKAPGDPRDTDFKKTDIEKLAIWMATGAGKTLIMHINYHQYLHYCNDVLDHVVLITPNEGLSDQHKRELLDSDIRCERFNVEGNQNARSHNAIQVIEITKLVKEKTGEGESVPVEAFEGNNLIIVDEGHKGTSSTDPVWRDHRETLAERGFTFEYSATFGQALAAAKNDDLVDEYGKAIVFDYSYRHFYSNGYGKDFRIINVGHDNETQTEILFLANLLSFYEQRRFFKENTDSVRAYGLDPPLWAFVGSKVNVVYQNYTRSDVLNVIRFLHRFLRNEKRWATKGIENILKGESGLSVDKVNDVFKNRLDYLKEASESASQIYIDILKEVFHTASSGALHLCDVKNAQGEIALKTTYSKMEFGLINIGDVPKFKKLVEKDDADIIMDPDDVLTESLFNDINKHESSINILIGAKKFIEGWDSWRVTAMGLLNIGRQEGSQIIQLFGRGVRLRGKDMSLKRSTALDGDHPPNLPLLETLNIFAVRANFMEDFQEYLEREGIPHEYPIQIELPIKRNLEHLAKRLYVPKVLSYDKAAKGKCVMLEACEDIIVTHTTQTVRIIGSSSEDGFQEESAEAAIETSIDDKYLDLIDWEKIYLQLVEYKQVKGYHNLIFDKDILRDILNTDNPLYELKIMARSEVEPKSLEQLKQLEELALALLRKYIDKFYRIIQKRWNDESVRLKQLDAKNPNFTDWKIFIPRKESEKLEPLIKHLIKDGSIYESGITDLLTNIHNERHLYQPLLTIGGPDQTIRITPPALEKSEEDFVKHLRSYVRQHKDELLSEKEVFLLRNQSRGKGVGFYENEGFFPDFILWILDGIKQRIVFIEPHGMIHEPINENNPKIMLFKRLRDFSYRRFRGEHVQMDSFIISDTRITKLRHRGGKGKQELQENWHILFPDENDLSYLSPIFQDSDPGNT